MACHELGSYVSLRIIDEIAERIGAEAWLGYDITGRIAVNAGNKLPGADKAGRNLVAAFTANAEEDQSANDETSQCDTTCACGKHLTRIRLQRAMYFCLHRGSLSEDAAGGQLRFRSKIAGKEFHKKVSEQQALISQLQSTVAKQKTTQRDSKSKSTRLPRAYRK